MQIPHLQAPLTCARGEVVASGSWIPLVIGIAAQRSVMTIAVAENLDFLQCTECPKARVVVGTGQASTWGMLRGAVVKLGELDLKFGFHVLGDSQNSRHCHIRY